MSKLWCKLKCQCNYTTVVPTGPSTRGYNHWNLTSCGPQVVSKIQLNRLMVVGGKYAVESKSCRAMLLNFVSNPSLTVPSHLLKLPKCHFNEVLHFLK